MSQPPRKKLRRGTKSCLECRRRKVKCTYSGQEGHQSCDECLKRQTTCEPQAHGSDPSCETTQERVDRLEATVKSLSETVTELHSSRLMSSNHDSTPIPTCRTEDCGTSDNGYFESAQGDDAGCGECVEQVELRQEQALSTHERILSSIPQTFGESPRDRIRAQLASAIPSRSDLLVLTASALDWWQVHKALLPDPPINSRIDFIERHEALFHSSTHSAAIATWLLCLAISFLQLPPAFDFSALESVPEPTQFVPRLVRLVEEMLANDELAGSLEGIECAAVFAQIQKFIGRPKKGWLVVRRAIAFAELLRLPSSRSALLQLQNNTTPNPTQVALLIRQSNVWTSLNAIDRLLCLLLGNPIATPSFTPDIPPTDPNASTKRIIWVQSEIHNQIVQRDNLEPSSPAAWTLTKTILAKCHALARTFPPEWKAIDHWATFDARTGASVMMQSGHAYLVLRATMPYLLKSKEEEQEDSSIALECIKTCREFLRRYFAVRTRLLHGAFLSRSFDMHAFTASVILLLQGGKFTWRDGMGDAALVENVKAVMGRDVRAGEEGGKAKLTRRMIECLEALQQFVEGEAGAEMEVGLRVPILGVVRARRDAEKGEVVVEGFGVGLQERADVVEWDFDALAYEDWDPSEF